jgi:intracellular sulfur oxidation DsrE/DsrF family protein
LFGQFGPVTNPTCNIANVASGTYKMGIRGISYSGIGSEKILSGSVTVVGTVTPPAKTNQTFTALPKTAKAGKSVSIAAATKQKVAVKVVVSGKGCKVAAVKDKNKKVVSHKLTMGAKGVTCKVTVTAVATSTLKAFSYVANIKAN